MELNHRIAPRGVILHHTVPDDWDFRFYETWAPGQWFLETGEYVSPPSSLTLLGPPAGLGDTLAICQLLETQNLQQGRIITYTRQNEYPPMSCRFYLGIRAPSDAQIITNSLTSYREWTRVRCSWWLTFDYQNTHKTRVRVELWLTDHWHIVQEDDFPKLSGDTNRIGIGGICDWGSPNNFDDTEIWVPSPLPLEYQWPFWEHWGTTLDQYNPWHVYPYHAPPQISFENGVIVITNPGLDDCGIYLTKTRYDMPLTREGKPLCLSTDSPDAAIDSSTSFIAHEFIFEHADIGRFRLYFKIAHGPWYPDEQWGEVGGYPFGSTTIGIGAHQLNLVAWFQYFREKLGLPTNPSGWWLQTIAFALGTTSPSTIDYLKNNFIGFYFQQ